MSLSQASRPGPEEPAILRRFGLDAGALLGAGGESRVFALDADRVLRIFHPSHGGPDPRPARLMRSWVDTDAGLTVPVVLDEGRQGGQHWTVDRRIPGRSLLDVLRETPDAGTRHRLLVETLDVAARLRGLPVPPGPYRTLCTDDPPAATLADLLDQRIATATRETWPLLAARVPGLGRERDRLREQVAAREVFPAFVHLDFYPGNVLAEDGRITGVCDISVHALAADPVLDEVGAVCLLVGYPGAEEDSRRLQPVLEERLGCEAWLVDAYRRFYGFYYAMDAALLDWAAAQFRPAR